jgi:cytosine/adenosine deaminase-related metal-dependent hydrolase
MQTPERTLVASHALLGPSLDMDRDVAIHIAGGVISTIGPAIGRTPRCLVMPALVNAHDHVRPLALSSFGAIGIPLESWLPRSILAAPSDPYLAAVAPLARAAAGGCGSVMIHYTRPSGRMNVVDEARLIAKAANDVGVRIAFALAVRDRNPIVYGEANSILDGLDPAARREIEKLFFGTRIAGRDYVTLVEEIAAAIAGPMVDVQYGPAGVQWCSDALLEAIADRSAATGRRIHMHLLETPYQRDWARAIYPGGLIRHLKDIGLLSERLTLAHCVYADEAELEIIAESGARIVTNFSSNLHLGSGIAPIQIARQRGCRCCAGLDGLAFDEDDDMVREIRLVQAMHGGWGFLDPQERVRFLAETIATGRQTTGTPGADLLAPGAPADFLCIDVDALDRDEIMEIDPVDLFYARGNKTHIAELVVAGRTIVRRGRLLGIDLDAVERELRARFRQDVTVLDGFRAAWPSFSQGIRAWYATPLYGCV